MVELLHHELLDTLHDGSRSSVYLGRKKSTGKMCVIKVARKGVNGTRNVAVLKRQYEITRHLDLDGIVRVYDLEVRLDYAALIMEYFVGRSLRTILDEGGEGVELARAVRIALQLADTLGAIHERNIIHKDIKPSNIIVDHDVSTSKLTDFSIASLLPGERAAVYDPWSPGEGTLQYISPEQTGRMNRSIDFRSDYYSLGVTLYELTTRRLPFETTDPLELVHHHIAKTPVAPHRIRPEIPEALSRVIMKLLSKTAEERYQSIFGLKADLRACLEMIESGAPALDFVPGRMDRSTRLQVSQKLYGRKEEVDTLLAAFRRINASGAAGDGRSELVLVAGYSGVGKSAVVSEIHKPIAKDGGYFAAGKFDQFTRNVPYAAVITALREVVRQLLTTSKDEIADWRARIAAAVTPNGQVIAEVIPEIELIIGKQPPVPALGSMETRNRFDLTFRNFIGAIALKTRALVLFLDDLQWADTGSLNLIEVLVRDPDIRHLLLIGSYRDNGVDDAHPLRVMLSALDKSAASVSTIALKPLAREHVNELVSDSLGTPREDCRPLSDIIFAKTDGNPFFAIQYLESLCREGHLRFGSETGAWRWSIADIESMDVADNVVDLMVRRIQGLARPTQQVLQLAACIGNQFDLKLLALLHQKDLRATDEDLWDALDAGLVVPVDSDYKIARFLDDADGSSVTFKFLHDRVQQAAYKLLSEGEKKRTHLELGRLLLKETPAASIEERIYDIVMHLNMGAEMIVDRQERREAAALNLRAGQKARRSTAYGPAVQCLRASAAFLPDDAWETDHDLSLAVYTDLVELEYLTINFDRAESYAQVVVDHARDVLEKLRVYETRIQFYISQNRMPEAIDVAMAVLAMLDVPLCETPPAEVDIHRLAQLPMLVDRRMLAANRILVSVFPAAVLAKPYFVPQIAFTMMSICTQHGISPSAAYACAIYGHIQCSVMNNIELGYTLGRLAIDLIQRFGAVELESKIYTLNYVAIHHWKRHLRETIDPVRHAVQVGLETGDIEYAGYSSSQHSTYSLFAGEHLRTTEQRMTQSIELASKLNQQYQLYYVKIWHQLVRSLRDPWAEKLRLVGESFDETTMIPCLGPNRTSVFCVYLAKAMLLYHFGEPMLAYECLRTGEEYQDAVGFVTVVQQNLYCSLSALAALDRLSREEQDAALAKVDANQRKLEAWAFHAPENNQHKHDLVGAELARVRRSVVEAMELYDRAIEGARRHGYIQEEALACELASSFYRSLGRHPIAQQYMTMAYRGYALWGATAKCQSLVSEFPHLMLEGTPERATPQMVTSDHGGAALDLLSVVRASQTMASEIVLERLLENLMTIVLENVGAQRGVLALAQGDALFVEAEGSTEPKRVTVLGGTPLGSFRRVPLSVISYVQRTQTSVLLDDAADQARFSADPYIQENKPRSLMCTPIVRQGRLVGVLYLENNLSTGVFTKDRLDLLGLLSTQIAISIENAKLYEGLELEVAARTEELRLSNERLRDVNDRLQVELTERVRLQEERVRMQEEIIQTQRDRLFELSTPFIPITDEIMVMPIIGTIDDKRAAQMLETAMEGVAASSAKVVIVDVTGVKSVDTSVASRLMSLAKAVGLLGSRAILTGLRPAVAQSLVALGVDLGSIETRSNLKTGIAYAMRRTAARLHA